jgi:hypothetical protein
VVYAGQDLPDVDVWIDDDFGGLWVPGELLMSLRTDAHRWRHLVRWWPGGQAHLTVVGDGEVRRDDPAHYEL